MSEEKIMEELEEISEMVEGEDTVSVEEELNQIEELAKEEPQEEKKEEKETAAAGATAAKETEEKKVEKKEEVKKEEKPAAKEPQKAVKKPAPAPEKAVKSSNAFLYASALLILVGLIIYGLAFYLRWNGWRIINNPPSSAVAIGGTLLILAGGELFFRGKER